MCEDNDIKIAGVHPLKKEESNIKTDTSWVKYGKILGNEVAKEYVNAVLGNAPGSDNDNLELLSQRKTLLAFSALSGFEEFCKQDAEYLSASKRSFFEYLKNTDQELYSRATDNGALSFYYLAYRRGNQVDRRVGQTFAMLCSHDGDSVYQELGEALYCWFTSVVKNIEAKVSANI